MNQPTQQQAQISNNNHQIFKITSKQSIPLCHKVFTIKTAQTKKIGIYRDHFERVKEWMKMRFSGKSILKTLEKIEIFSKQSKEKVTEGTDEKQIQMIKLDVQTDYLPFPTLYQHLEEQANTGASIQPEKIDYYLYYTVQLFELILRGGSIPNFFYTPKNIFINRPPKSYDTESGTFVVNCLSTVGLNLLFLGEKIKLNDLEEIIPLLPSNLRDLIDEQGHINQKELNRIIKMKGLAWNLLCLFMKEVPNIIIREESLKSYVSLSQIFIVQQKHQQNSPMLELLNYHKDQLQLMRKQTGIKYFQFFKNILVNNCRDFTWENIYSDLFLSHLLAQNNKKQNEKIMNQVIKITGQNISNVKEKISKQILKQLWKHDCKKQQIKRFYKERCIRGGSMVYFLIRTNANFQNMMRHLNVLEFIDKTCFCDDLVKVHLNFIETSLQALPDLNNFRIPYSGVPPPSNMQSQEVSVYNSLTNPQEIIAGLRRQVGKERQFNVEHHSITTINQLNNALFRVH